MVQKTLSQNIKKIRIRHKLTMLALAKQSGVCESYICLIEAGKRIPKLDKLNRIATALRTSTSNLLREK